MVFSEAFPERVPQGRGEGDYKCIRVIYEYHTHEEQIEIVLISSDFISHPLFQFILDIGPLLSS